MAALDNGPPEDSAITNCPANAKNTPRQKISSECWPQTIAGHSSGDFKPGQWRGTEADGDGGERQKMREAQHVEIGLVDRIHPLGEPAAA